MSDYDPYAPKRDDGLSAYVVTTHSWGQESDRIEWAANLKEAKAQHGWTRQLHTTCSVRRARVGDMPAPVARGGVRGAGTNQWRKPMSETSVATMAVEICNHSGRHTVGDGDHNATLYGPCSQCIHYARVVEPIIAARLARVCALADKWATGRGMIQAFCADELRAALAAPTLPATGDADGADRDE